ncbi:amidase [Luminiphilus sp.]|nr:amidase [Luminiphilus sp.]
MPDLTELAAIDLASAIKAREVSCVEVMQTFLERIDALNPTLNALIHLAPQEDCLMLARQADKAIHSGNYRGWLHGIPIAIKDLSNARGFPTTSGSALFTDYTPSHDDPHVERMRTAGGIVIGKTNVPEWGLGGHTENSVFGLTGNARDQALSAGGSSGGAATAVASHMLPLADGSDMMGSLRTPAAFQSLVGFRPTPDAVPVPTEMDPMALGLVSIGPIARNVADATALFLTVSGQARILPSQLTPTSSLSPIRIGWLGDADGYWPTEEGILSDCENGLARLALAGASVDFCNTLPVLEELWPCWTTLRHHALSPGKALYDSPEKRALMGANWQWEISQGLLLNPSAIADAKAQQAVWHKTLSMLFSRYDVIAAPTCQVYPFAAEHGPPTQIGNKTLDTYHQWLEVSLVASLGNLPVVSLPLPARTPKHATGIQFMMPPGRDHDLLNFAANAEPALNG